MSRAKIITKEALNYAEALYQISSDIKNVMEFTALLSVDELRQALANPTISLKEKYAVIDRIFDGGFGKFMKTVCKNGDYSVLSLIEESYKQVWNRHNSVLEASLEYAEPVSEKSVSSIKAMLVKKYGVKSVELSLVENRDLIGGFRLYVNDKVYDKSVLGALDRMRRTLLRR